MKSYWLTWFAIMGGAAGFSCVDGGSGHQNGTGGAYAGSGAGANAGGTTSLGGGSSKGGATSITGACGPLNPNPLGCTFAWGAPSNGNNYQNLNFVSTWVGDETNGGLQAWTATSSNLGQSNQNSCGDCALVESVANSNSMVVLYAYFIGFQACKVGHYCDCNTSSPPNLCTNGAQWIRDNRDVIVNAYGEYARALYARSPNKPVIWWLEGDFVQYTYNGSGQQTNALTYAEAGQIARDITCAIKKNEPNAVVAMNHSPWISDAQATAFWGAQPVDALDLIWVQGPGDSDTLTNSGTYNAATANYAWLYAFTGKKIMAETSYQSGSGSPDRWSTTSAANIDGRINHGVIGVLVNSPATSYQSSITALGQLSSTCN